MNTNTYATIDAMITRFGVQDLTQITDNEPPFTGQINEVKLQVAIDGANAEVDAYLAKKLSVPTVLQSAFVQMMACDIARYHVVLGASRVSERDEKRYKLAVDNLKAVNEGKIGIGAGTPETNAIPANNLAQMTSGRNTVFGGSGW